MHQPYKDLGPPLRSPDEVVHSLMGGVPFRRVIHTNTVAFLNSVRKSERPFIPWLKTKGFLAHILKWGDKHRRPVPIPAPVPAYQPPPDCGKLSRILYGCALRPILHRRYTSHGKVRHWAGDGIPRDA